MSSKATPLRRQTRNQAAATPAAAAVSFLIRSAQDLSSVPSRPAATTAPIDEGEQTLGSPAAIVAALLCRRAVKVAAARDTPLPRGFASKICRGCALPLTGAAHLSSVEVRKLSRTQRRREGRKAHIGPTGPQATTRDRAAPQGTSRRRNTVVLRRVCGVCGTENQQAFFTAEAAYQVAGIDKHTALAAAAAVADTSQANAAAADPLPSAESAANTQPAAPTPVAAGSQDKYSGNPADHTQINAGQAASTAAGDTDAPPVAVQTILPEVNTTDEARLTDLATSTAKPLACDTAVVSRHSSDRHSSDHSGDPRRAEEERPISETGCATAEETATLAAADQTDISKLTVASLREILRKRGLRLGGTKAELIDRLAEVGPSETGDSTGSQEELPPTPPSPSVPQEVQSLDSLATSAPPADKETPQTLQAVPSTMPTDVSAEAAVGEATCGPDQPLPAGDASEPPLAEPEQREELSLPQTPTSGNTEVRQPDIRSEEDTTYSLVTPGKSAQPPAPCPESGSVLEYAKMVTTELKSHLRRRGLKVGGLKAELIQRLTEADGRLGSATPEEDSVGGNEDSSQQQSVGERGPVAGATDSDTKVTTADTASPVAPLSADGALFADPSHGPEDNVSGSHRRQRTPPSSREDGHSQERQIAPASSLGDATTGVTHARNATTDGEPIEGTERVEGGAPPVTSVEVEPEQLAAAAFDLSGSAPSGPGSSAQHILSKAYEAHAADALSEEIASAERVSSEDSKGQQVSVSSALSPEAELPEATHELLPPAVEVQSGLDSSGETVAVPQPLEIAAEQYLVESLQAPFSIGGKLRGLKRVVPGSSQSKEPHKDGGQAESSGRVSQPALGATGRSKRLVVWNTIADGWVRVGRSWWPVGKRRRISREPQPNPSGSASVNTTSGTGDVVSKRYTFLEATSSGQGGRPDDAEATVGRASSASSPGEGHLRRHRSHPPNVLEFSSDLQTKAGKHDRLTATGCGLKAASRQAKQQRSHRPAGSSGTHKRRVAVILGVTHNFRRQCLLAELFNRV